MRDLVVLAFDTETGAGQMRNDLLANRRQHQQPYSAVFSDNPGRSTFSDFSNDIIYIFYFFQRLSGGLLNRNFSKKYAKK